MAAFFTVYCKRSVAHVTPEQLLAGVRVADLHAIAEGEGVLDEVIVAALHQLRIENVDASGFRWYRLCYRPAGYRPIDVQRWQTADEVKCVVAEVLENEKALQRVRSHLAEAIDIVSVSFGATSEEKMAPVLPSEVARWLAEQFDGIIRAPDGT